MKGFFGSWHFGRIRQSTEAGDGNHTSRSPTCLLDGRIDNRCELLRDLANPGPRPNDVTDSELLACAYARYGDDFVERVAGDFALAVVDEAANRVLLARDRVGVRPLCYARQGDALLFASSPAQLVSAGMPAIPDEVTIADHFLYFLAADALTRTFFAGIHSLPPAHVLVATTG